MSFLSIAFLAALPLLAIPILLHLFDRQRNVVIPWGAMQFLVEAATRQQSARRVQHWLLMLIRIAALAALILALARPLVPNAWLGGNGPRELIIVLDNSMSTTRVVETRPLFEQLVERAEQLLSETAPGDSARILVASPYPIWLLPANRSANIATEDLRKSLRAARPTLAGSDLQGALLKAVSADPRDEALTERRVVLLTDGQATDWQAADTPGWKRFRDRLATASVPTSLAIEPIGGERNRDDNLAVNRVRADRTVVGVNQPFTVTAEIQNYSASGSAPSPIHWLVEGEPGHGSQLPALAAGETHDAAWTHSMSRTGAFTLTCRVDAEDMLPVDDQESIVIEVVERVPVLLIEGATELAELQQDAYLVQAALGRIESENQQDWKAVFEPRTVPPQRLETIELEDFRAVVVPNLTELTPLAVSRLTEFVSQGGGLWMALGPRTDIQLFNRRLFQDGEGLSPVGVEQMVNETSSESKEPTINPFLKRHPATVELADNDRLDIGDVKVTRRFRFQMPDGHAHVPILLDLSSGEPLVVERQVGRGRIIVQAIPLRLQWSDLAVSQAFVVMVHDWLGYLTEPGATRHNLPPGHPIAVHVPLADDTEAMLTLPDGTDVPVAAERVGDGTLFRTSRTALPGSYRLEVGVAGDAIPFHVARDPAESDLRGLEDGELTNLVEAAGLEGRGKGDGIAGVSGGTRRSDPVWPALLVLLLVLIVADLLLSGRIARGRFGAEGIAERSESIAIADQYLSAMSPHPSAGTPSTGTPSANKEVKTAQVVRQAPRQTTPKLEPSRTTTQTTMPSKTSFTQVQLQRDPVSRTPNA